MARPKPTRISGAGHDIRTPAGKAAYQRMKYARVNKETNCVEVDTDRIKEVINAYLKANEYKTEIVTEKDGTTVERQVLGVLSRQGMMLALGISDSTLWLWLNGYVSSDDMYDEGCKCNESLIESLFVGKETINKYLVETNDKYGDTKRIKLLETYGVISPTTTRQDINVNISLGKWGKRSK